MRISALHVDAFGVWRDLRLEEFSPEVTVFYGPNEAGKTTLLEFLRSTLFGCSGQRQRRYLEAVDEGTPGGTLLLEGPRGKYTLERRFSRLAEPNAGRLLGQVELKAQGGARQGDLMLKTLLGGIDEVVFNNVFAIGLRELQELGSLTDSAAGELLYALTTGVDRVSLGEILRELRAGRERLLGAPGQPSQIANLLAQRDRLRDELAAAQSQQARHASLARSREELEHELTRGEQELSQLEIELAELELASSLRDRWRTRAALEKQLAAAADRPRLHPRSMERFEEIQRQTSAVRQRLGTLGEEYSRLRSDITAIPLDRELVRQSQRLLALSEQRELISTLEDQAEQLATQIHEIEVQLAGRTRKPAQPAAADGVAAGAGQVTPQLLLELRSTARQLRRHQRRWNRVRPRYQRAATLYKRMKSRAERREVARISREERRRRREERRQVEVAQRAELHSTGGAHDEIAALVERGDVRRAIDEAGRHVTLLRRRVQLESRLDQMARHRRELDEQSADSYEGHLLPQRALWGFGAVIVGGLVLLLASLLFPATIAGTLGWTITLMVVIGGVLGLLAKFWIEQQATEDTAVVQRQLRLAENQLEQAHRERDELDAQLPRGSGPLLNRLHEAEKRLAELETIVPAQKPLTTLVPQAPSTRRRSGPSRARLRQMLVRGRQARRRGQQAQARWQQLLSRAGLPEDFSVGQLSELHAPENTHGELRERLFSRREELAERRRALDDLAARVRQLLPKHHVRLLAEDSLSGALGRLNEMIAQQRQLLTQRRNLRRRQHDLLDQRRQLRATGRLWRKRRQKLWATAGARSEEQFRGRWHDQLRLDQVRGEFEALSKEITGAIGEHIDRERIEHLLEQPGHDTLDRQWEACTARVEQCRGELRERYERRGELNQQLKALLEDRQAALKQLELNQLDARLSGAARQWQTLALTSRVLERVRGRYERERQPETLQEASRFLERLTEGRYVRVWTPMDEHNLFVETSAGVRRRVEELSRGTREQLFVSLRMALAAAYGRRGVLVPLVMDDLLVNFDDNRAGAAARAIRDFAAEGHQVLVFTCHEHIANLFESIDVQVRDLPLREGLKPRRPRITAPPAPVVVAPQRVLAELRQPAPPPAVPTPPLARPVREVPAARRPIAWLDWRDVAVHSTISPASPWEGMEIGQQPILSPRQVQPVAPAPVRPMPAPSAPPKRPPQPSRSAMALYRQGTTSLALVEDEPIDAWESVPPLRVAAVEAPRVVRADDEDPQVLRWRWVWVNPTESDAQDFAGEFSDKVVLGNRPTERAPRQRRRQ